MSLYPKLYPVYKEYITPENEISGYKACVFPRIIIGYDIVLQFGRKHFRKKKVAKKWIKDNICLN